MQILLRITTYQHSLFLRHFATTSWKTAQGSGWPALGACRRPRSPLLLNSNASILVRTFLWPHNRAAVVVVVVVACFAPPAVKTVALGAPRGSAPCESREPILLGMVFWGPAMSPQVAETFWPLLTRDYTKEALF